MTQEQCEPSLKVGEQLVYIHLPQVRCKWIKTVESAVTTAWGVRWNEMQIARDVLQNFSRCKPR